MNHTGADYKVCLLGASLDVGNMGVRALAASLIKLIVDCKPKARIFLMYGNRSSGSRELCVSGRKVKVQVVNYRWSPKARLQEHLLWILFMACLHRVIPMKYARSLIRRSAPWLKTLVEADWIGDIRGGDSFSDVYGLGRFFLGSIPRIIVILMDKELVLLPQTYGPFKAKSSKRLARWIMARSSRLYSRDRSSMEVIRNSLGHRSNGNVIRFCPDVGFTLGATHPDRSRIEPALDPIRKFTLVGLNVSGLLYMGGYTRNNMFGLRCDYKELVHELLRRFMKEPNVHLLIVPHVLGSAENEAAACRAVWRAGSEEYGDRVHLVTGGYDQSEIKGVIGLCDFFLGSRMHACIAALSQGIPTVGLAYSRKFQGVFQSIGMAHMVLEIRQLELRELLAECIERFKEREVAAKLLKKEIPKIQAEINVNFKQEFLADNIESSGVEKTDHIVARSA